MKIKLLHTITAGKAGDTIEVTASGAAKLIELGVAEEARVEPKPTTKRRSKTKSTDTNDNEQGNQD